MRSLRALRPPKPLNTSPVPHTTPTGPLTALLGGSGSRHDKTANMQLYGTDGSVFGVVSRLANSTAKVEWQLWRRRSRNPDKGARTLVEKHAALDLWDHPNQFMATQELVERTQQHVELTGVGVWAIGRHPSSTIPLELWPVRPDRIVAVPHPTDYLAGWCYYGPAGQRIPLGVDEIIQMVMPDPLNMYDGLGPIGAIRDMTESRQAAIEFNRRFFLNGAEPGGMVKFERTLSDTEFKAWQQHWREMHQGVNAAHRVGVLENAEWIPAQNTQRDMQFAELLRLSVDEVRLPFGIHKASLGQSDDVNLANAEAAQWLFASELLIPRLDRIKGKLNNQLLPLFDADPNLEFDYEDPRPRSEEKETSSMQARVNAAMAVVGAGGDWDETLAAFELPAIPRTERPAPSPAPAAPGAPAEDPDEDVDVPEEEAVPA